MSNGALEGESAAVALANEWFEAFAASPGFAQLTERQQNLAADIVDVFTRHMSTYAGESPRDWDRSGVTECCTEILPRKISAKPGYFSAAVSVLSPFLAFLADSGRLSSGRDLSALVKELEAEIVERAADSANWGPAKSFVMAAHAAGVDLSDKSAIDAFMVQYNERMFRQQFGRRPTRERPPFAATPWPAKNTPPPVGPYEPCPCGSGRGYKFCCKGRS